MSDMGAAGEQQFCLRWNNHQANFIQAFEGLLEEETFADVTLAVEGEILKCHKMVLAACSTYFKTVFSDTPCSHPVVFLKDVKVTEMKAILEYVYKGEVNVARNDLAAMLKVAQMLQIKGLMNTTDTALPLPTERLLHSSERISEHRPNEEVISTSTMGNVAGEHGGPGLPGGVSHLSPPHSTSSPYYGYRKSSPSTRENGSRFPLPVWALTQGLPLIGKNPAVVSAALHSSLAGRHSSLYGNIYEAANESSPVHHPRKNKMPGMLRNHDTPILRGVLGQVHADSSQAAQQHVAASDEHETHYRSHSNDSADNGSDGRRSSMDLSSGRLSHSPYTTGASMMEEDEKKPLVQSFSEDKKGGN